MTRLAVALVVFAGGLVAAHESVDVPVVTPSAATPGKHRASTPRVSRWVHRLPLAAVRPASSRVKARHQPKSSVSPAGPSRPVSDQRGDALNWDALADCESSGDWHANTGNGFYGGLQFTLETWQAYGGVGLPSDASRSEQIAVASRLYAARGSQPWPVCGWRLAS